jgi:hypothetical protein
MLTRLRNHKNHLGTSFEALRDYSEVRDKSWESYSTDRGHMFFYGNENFKEGKDGSHPDIGRLKHMKSLFDDYDYLTDHDRQESLFVWTNESVIESDPDLEIFS